MIRIACVALLSLEKGVAIARKIASDSVNPVITERYFEIGMICKDLQAAELDVLHACIVDEDGRDLVSTVPGSVPSALKQAHPVVPLQNSSAREIATERGPVLDMVENRGRIAEERERLIAELRQTLGEVKTVRGFLPICSSCKKTGDDQQTAPSTFTITKMQKFRIAHPLQTFVTDSTSRRGRAWRIMLPQPGYFEAGGRHEARGCRQRRGELGPMDEVIRNIVQAHGGADLWRGLDAVEAVISAKGFLFTAKRRPVLERVRMRASTREPRFGLLDYPRPGQTAEIIGTREVRITNAEGRVIAHRVDPRAAFHGLRRLVRWDDLDFIYFAGYATWNYLTTPFLFLRDGFAFRLLDPVRSDPPGAIRLHATFPDDIPTHSREQVFHFDAERLLRRIDYTAEVVGGWAHAAHFCEEYRTFDGIRVPTRRRVLPLLIGDRPLPGPTLVAIDVHELRGVKAQH